MTNVLFITLDQLRGDALSCAGHPLVQTPNLDRLAAAGVRFARHYAQAAPCAPGRAALYTGTYQMNNRVVGNGTPLDHRFDNVAWAARRAGYAPTLFGYTDQGADPRLITDPTDPRLFTWEGVLPGFDVELQLTDAQEAWLAHLDELGYEVHDSQAMLATEHDRPVEHSVSAFLTDRFLAWLDRQDGPWFAHASYLRPHPPYDAAGEFARRYDPEACSDPLPAGDDRHWLHDIVLALDGVAAPTDPQAMRALRAQYFGMVTHVDAEVGRLLDALVAAGQWDDTIVVLTADHGEQLGDQGLLEKLGWFESSYHIPAIVRDPRRPATHGTVVDRFTENVDLLPTLCDLLGLEVPSQCDGVPLTPFLDGVEPPWWREAAHWEWDWREHLIPAVTAEWPWDRRLEQSQLAVRRTADRAYVHFGDGSWRCYDLAADPTWRTLVDDPTVVLGEAQAMLDWRSHHLDRTLTGMLLTEEGTVGRLPPGVGFLDEAR